MKINQSLKKHAKYLYDKDKDNQSSIEKKTNDSLVNKLDDTNLKRDRVVVEETLSRSHDSFSITNIDRNKLLPVSYSYNFELELELLSKFLPLINWSFTYETIGDVDAQFAGFNSLETDQWDTGWYDVKGDSTQIWNGPVPPTNSPDVGSRLSHSAYVADQSDIDNGYVNESMTLPAWKADIEWTESGNQYRIREATLCGFVSNQYDQSSSPCGGHTDYSILRGSMWWDSPSVEEGFGNFVNINGTTLSLKGRKYDYYYLGTEETCNYYEDQTPDQTETMELSDLESLIVFGRRQRWNGSYWVYDPYGTGFGYDDYYNVPGSGITSWDPEVDGYFVYYSNKKRYIFSVTPSTSTPVLNNIPEDTPYDTIPYSKIYFKVNPDDKPSRLSERYGTYTENFVRANLSNYSARSPVYIRKSKSTDTTEKWIMRHNMATLRMVPASKQIDKEFIEWDDEYTKSGDEYYLTSEDHGTKTKQEWDPPDEDLTMTVKGVSKSPFKWKKTKKYRTTST